MGHRSTLGDTTIIAAGLADLLIDVHRDMTRDLAAGLAKLQTDLTGALGGMAGPVAVVVEWDVQPRARVVPGATTLTASAGCAAVDSAAHNTA